ncbi:hypothetical protein MTO96_022064 [Rhipicephalus appendiculatus]
MSLSYFVVVLVAYLQLSLAVSNESNDIIDSFEVFEKFPFAIAISDVNNDTTYECLTAKRAWFDKDAKKGEYIWQLRGHKGKPKKTVSFYVAEGNSPDTFTYMDGSDDATPELGKFYYSDYKSCGVLEMSYNGPQCILWVAEECKDSPPQECVDQFQKHCGEGVSLYNKDICLDSEVTNW